MKTVVSSFRRRNGLAATIEDEAALWIIRRDAGLSPTETVELEAWLAADARHAGVFAALEIAWVSLNGPRREGRGELLAQEISWRARQGQRRRRRVFNMTAVGLAAAAALVFAVLPVESLPPVAAPSIALRPDRQLLPDGSAAELNAGAEIAVQFTPEKRTVRLVRGEALFDVVEDADRPFVVAAGQIEIRAVGTAFAVRNGEDEIAVLVTKGQVAVQRADAGSRDSPPAPATVVQPIYLAAGRKMTIPLASTVAVPKATYVSPEELMEALAWRTRRVEFTSTPLREAVALFNRQPGKRLVVGDDATASLKITGVFWTDDPEGFSRLLVFSLGLKADTSAEGRIVLRVGSNSF